MIDTTELQATATTLASALGADDAAAWDAAIAMQTIAQIAALAALAQADADGPLAAALTAELATRLGQV